MSKIFLFFATIPKEWRKLMFAFKANRSPLKKPCVSEEANYSKEDAQESRLKGICHLMLRNRSIVILSITEERPRKEQASKNRHGLFFWINVIQ